MPKDENKEFLLFLQNDPFGKSCLQSDTEASEDEYNSNESEICEEKSSFLDENSVVSPAFRSHNLQSEQKASPEWSNTKERIPIVQTERSLHIVKPLAEESTEQGNGDKVNDKLRTAKENGFQHQDHTPGQPVGGLQASNTAVATDTAVASVFLNRAEANNVRS